MFLVKLVWYLSLLLIYKTEPWFTRFFVDFFVCFDLFCFDRNSNWHLWIAKFKCSDKWMCCALCISACFSCFIRSMLWWKMRRHNSTIKKCFFFVSFLFCKNDENRWWICCHTLAELRGRRYGFCIVEQISGSGGERWQWQMSSAVSASAHCQLSIIPIIVTSLPYQCHWLTNRRYPAMIKSNQHENDVVMWLVNYALNQELNPQYNCWYPSVNCCDDGEDDFVYCSMHGSTDFVDLTTITMDHNVEFQYLNHRFHSYHCGRCYLFIQAGSFVVVVVVVVVKNRLIWIVNFFFIDVIIYMIIK